MARKRERPYKHPLDSVLAEDPETDGFHLLAHKFAAEPFDSNGYRNELEAKIDRLKYPQPQPRARTKGTFRQVLESASLLEQLLSEETIWELRKSEVLQKVFAECDQLKENKQLLDGSFLADRRRNARGIRKDQRTLERLRDKHGSKELGPAIEELAAQAIPELVAVVETRKMGSKEKLLTSKYLIPSWKRNAPRPGDRKRYVWHRIKSDATAIQVIICRTLMWRLRKAPSETRHLPDIFFCQLAELIWRPAGRSLTSGETIRRAHKELA